MHWLILAQRAGRTPQQGDFVVPGVVLSSPAAKAFDKAAMALQKVAPYQADASRGVHARAQHIQWLAVGRVGRALHHLLRIGRRQVAHRRVGREEIQTALAQLLRGARDEARRQEQVVVMPQHQLASGHGLRGIERQRTLEAAVVRNEHMLVGPARRAVASQW